MLKEEYLDDDKLIRHYSDDNKFIIQEETNILYLEAIDVIPCKYSYKESDIVVPNDELNDGENTLCEGVDAYYLNN